MAHNESNEFSPSASDDTHLVSILGRRYTHVRRLGEGGQGVVHLVEDRYLGGRLLVIKILHPKAEADWRTAFRHEFEALAGLKHPRLSEVHDFGTTPGGRIFFTRDYLAGDDLLNATRGMGVTDVIALFVEICRSLKPLHSRGLVHGDLKPGNIICAADGIARLIDFSFVRGGGEDAKRRGTVPYMAPEVIEKKRADARADLYSLGATMFEILAGAPPFEGSVTEIVKGHLGEPRPVPEPRRLIVLPEEREAVRLLQSIVVRLLSRIPQDRFPNIFELAAALTAASPTPVSEDPLPDFPVVSESLGRDRELSALQQAVSARLLPSDLSPLVVLEGQLGTGKSALIRNTKWWAQLKGIPVIETGGSGGLLRPVVDMIEQATFHLAADEETRRRAEQLLITLSEPRRTFAHLDVLTKSVGELLIKVAGLKGLLLLFDGLEQASPETLTVLRGVIAAAERDDPIVVVATSETPFAWRDHLGTGESVTMPLLSFEQVASMAECFLGSAEKEVVDRILAHTGGNPLFVTTLLSDLSASPEGAARMERLGPPKQLEAYWKDRILTLSESERMLMEAAAVLGRPATAAELAKVAGKTASELERDISALTLGSWLRRSSNECSITTLPLGREIIGAADPARLVPMHARAMSMETDEARQLFHAAKCGDKTRVVERGAAVAASLRRLGALNAASELLSVMREAIQGDKADIDLALELGRVCLAEGNFEDAERCLKPLLENPITDVRREACILLGRLYIAEESLDMAAECLQAALQLENSASDNARILFQLANIAFKQQDMAACIAFSDNGLTDAPRGERVRADLLGMLAKAAIREGRKEDALIFAEEAEADARLAGDMRAVALAIDILAWVNQRSGNLEKATEALERAVLLHFEFGDLPALMRDRLVLGDLQLWQEDWAAALRNYEQAVRLSRASVNPVLRLNVHNNYGCALIKLGYFERAQLVLQQTVHEAEVLGQEAQRLLSNFYLGVLAAARGDGEEALSRYAEAASGFDALVRPAIVCEIELETAGFLIQRGTAADLAQAESLIEKAARRQREEEGRHFDEALALQQGALAVARGRLEEGLKILDGLCERAETKGLFDFAWQAHFAAAKGYLASESAFLARRRLRRAEEILDQLSAGLSAEHRTAFWQDVRRFEVRNLLGEISSSNQFSSTDLVLRAEGDVDAEARALYRVLELNAQLLSDHDLDTLLKMILSSAIELTGAERGLVLLPPPDPENGILEVRAVSARAADPEERFSCSIAESVFLDGEPVVTVDAMQDARFNEFMSIHELKLKSVACLPVSHRGSPLGVLYLENRLRQGRFCGKDLRVLAAFADQVAIALTQNRMVTEIRARAQELVQAKAELQEALDKRLDDLNLRDMDLKVARERLDRIRRQVEGDGDYHGVLGISKAMQKVFAVMERVKDLNVPIVFVGESGTGKDLLARVLHEQSNLKDGPFVTAACGSVPETLVESMLFGHEKGAFSGADADRIGLLQAADGGTLYLDELGDMSPRMQVDLLRVLQEGNFTPVGSQRTIRINLRILASSRIPLERLVEEGGLRRDLLYRLQVVTIELPPLKQRKEDILPLARRILARESARFSAPVRPFSKEAAAALLAHPWPGNIRELEQMLRRVLAVGDASGPIAESELFVPSMAPQGPVPSLRGAALADGERREDARILAALEENKWNRSKAAEVLGMPRRTFYRRLEKMGLIKKR